MARLRKRKQSVQKPALGSKPSAETSSVFDWLESVELTHGSLAGIEVPSRAKPEMLTDSEIQLLRQRAKETSVFARKAFAHLRPKKV